MLLSKKQRSTSFSWKATPAKSARPKWINFPAAQKGGKRKKTPLHPSLGSKMCQKCVAARINKIDSPRCDDVGAAITNWLSPVRRGAPRPPPRSPPPASAHTHTPPHTNSLSPISLLLLVRQRAVHASVFLSLAVCVADERGAGWQPGDGVPRESQLIPALY